MIARPTELEELAKFNHPTVPKIVALWDGIESFDERLLKLETQASPAPATLRIVDRDADSAVEALSKMSDDDIAKTLMKLTQQHPLHK